MKVDSQVITGQDLKLSVKSKKKKYKAEKLSKRDLRNLLMYIKDGATCDCPQLTSAGSKDKVIIMGHKKDGRAIVSSIFKYDRKSKDLRQAIKAIQKEDTCKKGLGVITALGDEGLREPRKRGKGRKGEGRKGRGSGGDEEKKEGDEQRERKNKNKKERDNNRDNSKKSNDRRRNRNGNRNN